jgi:hypothetical protein
MHVNGKMRPVETIPAIRGEGIKRMTEGVNLSMMCLIYYKNFFKCHMCPTQHSNKK